MPTCPLSDPESSVLGLPNAASMATLGGKEVVNPASLGFIGSGNMAQALLGAFIKKGKLLEQMNTIQTEKEIKILF